MIELVVIFLVFVFTVALYAAIAGGMLVIHGWVLSILWSWFIVPVFGLPILSITVATSIVFIINFLFYPNTAADLKELFSKEEKSREEKMVSYKVAAALVLKPFLILFFGYIIHSFM